MTTFTVAEKPKLRRVLSGAGLEPRGSLGFLLVLVIAVIAVGGAAMAASIPAQVDLGRFVGLSEAAARSVPIVVDGPIIVYVLVGVWRASFGKSIWLARLVVAVFTIISMAINALHVLLKPLDAGEPLTLVNAVAAFLSILMPLSILLVTETLTDLLVQKSQLSPEELRAQILREVEEEKQELARIADAQRLTRLEEEEIERQREKEAADSARWQEIKDSPKVSVHGSPERVFLSRQILSSYKETGSMQRTADDLEVEYHVVRQVIKMASEPESDTSR